MTAQSFRALIVLVVVGIIPLPVRGQFPTTAAQLTERIQREFPPIWDKATNSPFVSDCSAEQFQLMGGGERRLHAISLKGKRGAEGRFIWSHELSAFDDPGAKPFDSRVAGMNPHYEFKLRKSFGGAGWLLLDWRLADEKKPGYRSPVTYAPEIRAPFLHLAFGGIPLDKLVADANWKINSIQASPADAAQVRVAFALTQSTRPEFTTRHSGWLDLDPKAGWGIRRSDTTTSFTSMGKTTTKRTICDNNYDMLNESIPVLTQILWDITDIKSDGSSTNPQRRIFRLDTRYPSEVPDTEFTMAAFGLPEPIGMTQEHPTPRYVWFLVAAGGFVVVTVLFRWLARRSQPAPIATT